MKKYLFLLAIAAVCSWGCEQQMAVVDDSASHGHDHDGHDHDGHDHDGHDHDGADHDGHDGDGHEHAATQVAAYCGSCGQVAGTDACCKEGAAKCEKCGLHEGAPLCCKLEGDFAGKKLCGKCGQVAKTDACCKEGAAKCEKCGLHKGAPLCCKLDHAGGDHDSAEHHADEKSTESATEPKEPVEPKGS